MTTIKLGILTAFLISLTSMAAQYDPSIPWRSIVTEHFEIIHDSRQIELARTYALEAERVYARLQPLFKETPRERTTVVIADVTDSANGLATFIPYPSITVYPVLPNAMDSIDHFENWVYELLLHEYAHILTFLPAHGFYVPLKYVFGTVVRPTGVLPRWYLEGLAVEVESRFTRRGRLRSPLTSASLRALALAGRLEEEEIDRVNESTIPWWPYGQRPYLFGSLLWHRLAESKGSQLIEDLNQRYGRRLPFLLDGPALEFTAKSFAQHWQELRQEIHRETLSQSRLIEGGGKEHLLAFPAEVNESQFSPALSPNGRYLVYLRQSPVTGAHIQIMDRGPESTMSFSQVPVKTLTATKGALRLSWLPDSSGFVFEELSTHQRYYNFRQLKLWSLKTNRAETISGTERGQEASIHPAGKKLIFVRQGAGRTDLVELDLNESTSRVVFAPRLGLRLSWPSYASENEVIFAARNRDGKDQLHRFRIGDKTSVNLLSEFNQVALPQWTSRGLTFSATDQGVRNIFLANSDLTQTTAVSNSLTEASQGLFDERAQEWISVRLTSEGRRLFTSKASEELRPPRVPLLSVQNFKDAVVESESMPTSASSLEERSYQPWRHLLPRYWIPFVYPVEGGMLFQGSTQTSDPVGRHQYGIEASTDTLTQKLSYGLQYTNSSTPVDLTLAYAEANEVLGSNQQSLTHQNLKASGGFFWPGLSNNWRGLLGVGQSNTQIPITSGHRDLRRVGPQLALQYSNLGDQTAIENQAIGRSLSLGHSVYLPGEGRTTYDRSTLALGLETRWPFPSRHRFAFLLKTSLSPRMSMGDVVSIGDRTIGANYLVSLINSSYLLRGYSSGALVGRKLLNANLEYRFPLWDIYRGRGLWPIFAQRLSTTLFVDGAAVDGAYYELDSLSFRRAYLDRQFWSTGIEFNLSATAAYHLPLTVTLGLYYGFDQAAGGGFMPFLGIGYSGHGGLDHFTVRDGNLKSATTAW